MYPFGDTAADMVAAAFDAIKIFAGFESYRMGEAIDGHTRLADDGFDTFPAFIFHKI